MKIGIIGLNNSGKTTVFNALTGLDAEITSYETQKKEPNLGMVDVKDERITKLSEMYEPKKTIYANIEFVDFVGLSGNKEKGELFSPSSMALIKNTEALSLVVRNFNSEIFLSDPTPLEDIETIESELIFSDLFMAEKRKEKIILSKKRGIKDQGLLIEEKAIEKSIEALENEIPLRKVNFTDDEDKAIRGFSFLSKKPLMIILNSSENNFQQNENILTQLKLKYDVIEFAGNFEMELSGLPDEEAIEFMTDLGINESARLRLTKFSYSILGLISFFTVGKDEVRAWTINSGDDAVTAAGKIHSDLARGFIRAECFSYDDLIGSGSEKILREKGLFRLEGKTYLVKDGDILNIRFSV